jgi:hypothetical protein
MAGREAAASVIAARAEVGRKTSDVPVARLVPGQVDPNGKSSPRTPCTP